MDSNTSSKLYHLLVPCLLKEAYWVFVCLTFLTYEIGVGENNNTSLAVFRAANEIIDVKGSAQCPATI